MKATLIEPPPIHFEDCKTDDELRSLFTSQYLTARRRLGVDAAHLEEVLERARPYRPWELIDYPTLAKFIDQELGPTLDDVEAITDRFNQLRSQAKAQTWRLGYDEGHAMGQVQGVSDGFRYALRFCQAHPDEWERLLRDGLPANSVPKEEGGRP